jgi:hypothetical protein
VGDHSVQKNPRPHRLKVNSEFVTQRVRSNRSGGQSAGTIQQALRSTQGDRFLIAQAGELFADIGKQINLSIQNARRRGKAI